MDLNPAPSDSSTDAASLMPRKDRRTWWATLFLLCGILGAMLGLSVRTQQHVRRVAQVSGEGISAKQVDDQQRTIKKLQGQIDKFEAGATSSTAQAIAMADDLKSAKLLAGLTPVQGPGVVVTLNDSKNPFPGGLPPGMTPPNIIHDTDINQVVNELKAAGAEAVSVNDQRLVAVSPVRCAGPTVFVNNTAQTPPYLIKAIGDSKTLGAALNLHGGIADQIKSFDKGMFGVEPARHLVIPAYSGAVQPKYAVPAPAAIVGEASAQGNKRG